MSRLRCLSAVLVAHCLGRALGGSPMGTSADIQGTAGGLADEVGEDQWPTNATNRRLSFKPPTALKRSATIEHSNREGNEACKCPAGKRSCPGFVCTYTCDKGFLPVGQHVFREAIWGVVGKGFSGGRCVESCPGPQECSKDQVPIRYRDGAYTASGGCFKTACIDALPKCKGNKCSAEDAALQAVARGNWAVWQMARSEISGLYADHISWTDETPASRLGKADVTGCGIIMECIAHAMGWQTTDEAQSRVLQTLQALSNEIEGVNLVRSYYGSFFPGAFTANTGRIKPRVRGGGNVAATGLLFGGVLFAKTYFQRVVPEASKTHLIVKYARQLFESIAWDNMMCDRRRNIDSHRGTSVAWDVTWDGKCGMPKPIQGGVVQFNEAYVSHWLAYEWACSVKNTGTCKNMEHMWKAVQAAKKKSLKWTNPESGFSTDILSKWGSYVVQLPFYMASPFNSDPDFTKLFVNAWSADKDLYAHAPFYSPESYGLGAGPTTQWCAGLGYVADRLPFHTSCLTYTPEGTVGYLPTSVDEVRHDVLKMLEEGEVVTMVQDPGTKQEYPILARRMLADPEWRPYGATMIDLSGELFGLASYFLGKEFFVENTKHFQDWHSGTKLEEVDDAESNPPLDVASRVPEYVVFFALLGVASCFVTQFVLRLHRALGQVDQGHGSAASQASGINIIDTVLGLRKLGLHQGEPGAPLLG